MDRSSQRDVMYCPVRFGGIKKIVKNIDFDSKNQINRSAVDSFGWFMCVMVFIMRKTHINLN